MAFNLALNMKFKNKSFFVVMERANFFKAKKNYLHNKKKSSFQLKRKIEKFSRIKKK